MTTEAEAASEWEDEDKAMEELAERKWRIVICHECGHATAALANGTCPEAILIGQLRDDETGMKALGLTQGSGLPDDATAEAKATVLLAGVVAEDIILGDHDKGSKRDFAQLEPLVNEILKREGETRSDAKVREDLLAETKALLDGHKQILIELYEEGVKRAAGFGYVKLNDKDTALRLLFKEIFQYAWDEFRPK